MKFHTTTALGEKQHLTKEGFLVIHDVPVARTGDMIYGPGEVPVPPGPDGLITIHRDEEEVFRPEFMASLNGKPVVDDHPNEDVIPDNWKDYAVGHGMSPRRGSGMQADLLVMDIMVTDAQAIKAVRSGKRQISLGYDADYEKLGPGKGRQTNLHGNHIALVDNGRCGSRCAIGDKHTLTGDTMVTTRDKKLSWLDRLLEAVKSKDEQKIDEAVKAAEKARDEEPLNASPEIHVHTGGEARSDEEMGKRVEAIEAAVAGLKSAVDKLVAAGASPAVVQPLEEAQEELEEQLEEEAPAGTADKAKKARDSVYLEDSFQETVAAAEILTPGIRIPTYDRASAPKKTLDAICRLRRSALDLAYVQPETRGLIEEINGKPLELEKMSCSAVRTLFRSAVAMKKAANNSAGRTADETRVAGGGMGIKGPVKTPADLNKRMAERYAKQR